MNYIKKHIKKTLFGMLAIAVMLFGAASTVYAIPYNGADTPPAPSPAFNVYTGVPSEGNESDFFKGKVAGSTADSVNNVQSTCETGQKFQLRVYVHNGASQYKNDNGNGPSVAKDTKVKIALPTAKASSFTPDATISASNASSITDDMTITCTDGRVVTLKYVAGTAEQYSPLSGVNKVSDSIVTTGAHIGTQGPDGNVWGCWDQRVWVRLLVEVKEAPTPPAPEYQCKVTDVVVNDRDLRKVTANVSGVAINGATITGYEINFGDDTVVNEQSAMHEYAADGTYTITGRVQVKLPNGEVKWVEAPECVKEVTFEGDKPVTPVTPEQPETPVTPTTLPSTGAGSLAGIFTLVSAAGAFAHRLVTSRRNG